MLQRIQSLFLLCSSGSLASVFAFPFATSSNISQDQIFADGIFDVNDHLLLLSLVIGGAILLLINIFLYSNRKLQNIVNIIASLLIATIGGYVIYQLFNSELITIGLGSILTVVSLIFVVLASIYIRKDDHLVKSMDRLR